MIGVDSIETWRGNQLTNQSQSPVRLLFDADTGNSCRHPGYDEFQGPDTWPSTCAPSKSDWINGVVGLCGDGDAYPEEFWNCADIEITTSELSDLCLAEWFPFDHKKLGMKQLQAELR